MSSADDISLFLIYTNTSVFLNIQVNKVNKIVLDAERGITVRYSKKKSQCSCYSSFY